MKLPKKLLKKKTCCKAWKLLNITQVKTVHETIPGAGIKSGGYYQASSGWYIITLTFEVQFRKLTNANQMCVQYLQTCQVSLLTTFLFYLYFCSTRLVLRTSGSSCG